MIHPIKNFDIFGYDDVKDCIVKFNKAENKYTIVNPTGLHNRYYIQYQGRRLGVTFNKLKFCAIRQIDPTINSRQWYVSKSGDIITPRELIYENRKLGLTKREDRESTISKLKQERQWLEAALNFYDGKSELLFELIQKESDDFAKIVCKCRNVSYQFAKWAVVEAEYALLKAMEKGSVVNPKRYLIQRAKGIVVESYGKTVFPFRDLDNVNLR